MDKLSLQNPVFATYVIAATLAEAAHLTPRQFSRAFRAETGQSPAKVVENLRVEAAGLMMERSRHPIDVIARQTGFADRDRMRRAFRQPPQVIRRNARAEAMPGLGSSCGARDTRYLDLVAEATDAQDLLSLADGQRNLDQLGLAGQQIASWIGNAKSPATPKMSLIPISCRRERTCCMTVLFMSYSY
jgi:AraC-like DNA-binding protein